MSNKNYTEEEVMSALELRMYRDTLCRESFDLIKAKNLETERLKTTLSVYGQELQRKKAEAIKEFAESLKEKYSQADILCPRRIICLTEKDLENLVKEKELTYARQM